ncbi:unnamed protein product [Darwinula stevensoni]|uniref:Sulfotransferase domain-containing protein n=1 Tax=Darwinula stevensoni TaxID=69355 RepID=A0A7R9A653_9CRUS|nr:unnamed protein product [Darwinula stevensoni]CAG0893459.1 unnamed protein product [Darwinula stevensoni]
MTKLFDKIIIGWDCMVPPDGLPDLSKLVTPFDTIEEADKHFQKPGNMNVGEAIEKIARFLGKDLTQEQVKAVKEEASIERMREKAPVTGDNYRWKNLLGEDSTKPFIRDGQVGGWRNELTEEQIEKIDKYIQDYFQEMELYDTQK